MVKLQQNPALSEKGITKSTFNLIFVPSPLVNNDLPTMFFLMIFTAISGSPRYPRNNMYVFVLATFSVSQILCVISDAYLVTLINYNKGDMSVTCFILSM